MKHTGKHAIEILLPIVLSALFAMLTLLVLLLSANVYHRSTRSSVLEEQRYAPLTYLQEKIRQADGTEATSIEAIDGVDCLLLHVRQGDRDYVTCIFEKDGKLMELFTRSGSALQLAAAEPVMESYGLTMEVLDEGLFCFTSFDENGQRSSVILSERSRYGDE